MTVIEDIMLERERQKAVEGWTPEHDDGHEKGELAKAAACYAYFSGVHHLVREMEMEFRARGDVKGSDVVVLNRIWPWDWKWWKPKDRRRDLVRAAALIVAEIERLDRQDEACRKLNVA